MLVSSGKELASVLGKVGCHTSVATQTRSPEHVKVDGENNSIKITLPLVQNCLLAPPYVLAYTNPTHTCAHTYMHAYNVGKRISR